MGPGAFKTVTNEELQSIINKGDVCITDSGDVLRKFIGYSKCQWKYGGNISANFYSCSKCKGKMIFESITDGKISIKCRSINGISPSKNRTSVKIIYNFGELLSEELFEI